MIRPFKFFQKHITRRWLEGNLLGQLQWMTQPVGIIFYMERRWDGNFYSEELKSTTVTVTNRYFYSYNQFMEMNRNNVIFAYQFVDNRDLSNLIYYNQETFDDMPRDIPLIFRGVIRNNDTI
jgi:hypothetical protein